MLSSSSAVICFRVLILLLFTLCPNFVAVECHVTDNFASPGNLTNWADAELEIYKHFKMALENGQYDKGPSISKAVLQRYFKDLEDSNGLKKYDGIVKSQLSFVKEISQNPIKVYRMLRRINKYKRIIEAFAYKTFEPSDDEPAFVYEVPADSDVEEAMASILRLHFFYDFNLYEFTSGVIADIRTNATLDAIHCYEIGIHAIKTGYHDLAVEWLEMAFIKVEFQSDLSVKRNKIEKVLLDAIVLCDNEQEKIAKVMPDIFNGSLWRNYQVPGNYGHSNTHANGIIKRKTLFELEIWKNNDDVIQFVKYCRLCSGHNFQTEKEKAELYCWRDSGKNGVNVLSPSKLELLSKQPYLLQVYDVIEAKTSEQIIQNSESGFTRSTTGSGIGEESISSIRTSATSWLYIRGSETLLNQDLVKIEKRIESITGLKTKGNATEGLQVVSYVGGRHYNTHADTLNEPLLGGDTAFVQAGIAVKPVKGAAVFWFNLYRDGSNLDHLTQHGGCPVLLGHKYIANKWIRYAEQFLTVPCSLRQNDTNLQILIS